MGKSVKTKSSSSVDAASLLPTRPTGDGALVFVSHDSRDADLAEAFANLLTDASGGILKSFRSSDRKGTAGIEFGAEWYSAIMQKLDDATDVVALLTKRSINRPWILYETGVAKGKLESTVFGLALGVPLDDAAKGPFAQFQNSADDEDSITKLVLQLIRRNPQANPREEAVRRQVHAFREIVEVMLKERKDDPAKPVQSSGEVSVAKLFEEVKVLVRDIPERVVMQSSGESSSRRRPRRKDPRIFEAVVLHPALSDGLSGLATRFSLFAGIVRDDFPWLGELCVDFSHRLSRLGTGLVGRHLERLGRTADVIFGTRGLVESMGSPGDLESIDMTRHFFMLLLEEGRRIILDRSKRLEPRLPTDPPDSLPPK